jgi:hypothetical protein
MAAGIFGNIRLAICGVELALERVFMEVVAGDQAGARVGANLGGGKHILPSPFGGRPWILPLQCLGQVCFPKADGQVLEVLFPRLGKVLSEALLQCPGQRHHAVFAPPCRCER